MEWAWGFLFVGQSLKRMVERCQRRPLTHTDRSLKSSCLLPRCAIDESPTSARSTMSAFGQKQTFRNATAMSALGQKQTCASHKLMSALPPKATSNATQGNVRFGPIADMCSALAYVRTPIEPVAQILKIET